MKRSIVTQGIKMSTNGPELNSPVFHKKKSIFLKSLKKNEPPFLLNDNRLTEITVIGSHSQTICTCSGLQTFHAIIVQFSRGVSAVSMVMKIQLLLRFIRRELQPLKIQVRCFVVMTLFDLLTLGRLSLTAVPFSPRSLSFSVSVTASLLLLLLPPTCSVLTRNSRIQPYLR